jgi:fatty acid desaturase
VFKYPKDRLPVALILALTALDAIAYFFVEQTWVLVTYWLLLIIPKGIISAWNHHHQHVLTFKSSWLNRLYELSLAFHTGITSNLWVLHHTLGHHVNFLDQQKDESRWKRQNGKTMGMLEYTVNVAVTAYYRAYQVGRRYPRHQRVYLLWTTITFALVIASLIFRPLSGIFIVALPMVTSLLFTTWVTYDHHAGLDAEDQFQASYNITNRWFNRLTGNLGYHTAHHFRQAVHWSKLPELHASIAGKIPAQFYRASTFDVFFPDDDRREPAEDGPNIEDLESSSPQPAQ